MKRNVFSCAYLEMGGSAGKLYKAIKNPHDNKVLREAFDKYDADKSGVLDRVELQKVRECKAVPSSGPSRPALALGRRAARVGGTEGCFCRGGFHFR